MREAIQKILEETALQGHTVEKNEDGKWHINGVDSKGNVLEFTVNGQNITTIIKPPKETETSYQHYINIYNDQITITRNYTHTSFCGDPRGPAYKIDPYSLLLSELRKEKVDPLWENVADLVLGKIKFLPELAILKVAGTENFSISDCFQPVTAQ